MGTFQDAVRQHGGAIATHELYTAGFTRSDVARAVRRGELWRSRQGWYVLPGTASELFRGHRVGGVLTCGSSLRAQGYWVLAHHDLHVRVPEHDARLRTQWSAHRRLSDDLDPNVVVHWRERSTGFSRLLADPTTALLDMKGCASPEEYLVALDSVLHAAPHLGPAIDKHLQHPIGYLGIDGTCESGIETLCWLRMLRKLGALRQVRIRGVGRVDFMIGERLIVEVDGEEFHNSESTFERDRQRDAILSSLGYRVLRFSYRQVVHRFEEVELSIRAAIARGDHL